MPRRGHSDTDYLFHNYDFVSNAQVRQEKLKEAIDKADVSRVRAGSVDESAEPFVAEFWAEVPELTEGAISMDVEETRVNVTRDSRYVQFGPGPHYAPGIRASYFVPFVGDPKMFLAKPSTWTTAIPSAAIEKNELRFTFERAGQDVAETKRAFEEELDRVKTYLGWLRENVNNYNRELLPIARQRIEARRRRIEELERGTSSLGIPIRSAPPPARPGSPATATVSRNYDVALSFAGENRAYVEEVAKGLRTAGVEVFYDDFEKATLWGKNLVEHLADIYQHKSRYVVMFISEHYVSKAWPKHERQHAQARALVAKDEYILPARFDDTEVPGMTNTVGHVDLRHMSPQGLVDLILVKVGRE